MADPKRLLDGEGTDFERALLKGALAEKPSRGLTRQMALGIGVGAGVTYASTAKALMHSWWGKAAAVVTIGAGAAGVVALGMGEPEPAGGPASQAPAALPAPQAAEPSPAERIHVEDLADEASEPAAREDAEPSPGTATRPRPARDRSRAESTLAEEVRLLDRARALVRQGDERAALRVLSTYEQRYPQGVLRREAKVLRARASK